MRQKNQLKSKNSPKPAQTQQRNSFRVLKVLLLPMAEKHFSRKKKSRIIATCFQLS